MATAYRLLQARADEKNLTLTKVAARLLQEAAQR
jgi:AmiR/NasT family two-component response regulator